MLLMEANSKTNSNSEKKICASHIDRLEMLNIGLNNPAYIADNREIMRKGISILLILLNQL